MDLPIGRGRGRIDSPPQTTQPGHTPYLNPLGQLMEVQEQNQREEGSQREQRVWTREARENGPMTPVGTGVRNVLTLTGTKGSSIINVSLTSSLRSDIQLRAQTPSRVMTARPLHHPQERGESGTSNSTMGTSNNSTPLMQLQMERARHHYELHRLDQRVGERFTDLELGLICLIWMM